MALRNLTALTLLLLAVAGCKKETASTSPTQGSAAKPAAVEPPPAPEPTPDDEAVVAALKETKGVKLTESGENIVSLDLSGLFPDDAKDQADEFAWIKGLPKLTSLKAAGPGVTLEAVKHLEGHPSLSVVNFDNCTQVKDDAVAILAGLPKLVDVNLIKSDITNSALETLSSCKTIRRIRIARTKVTDDGIKHLENAPQLELLDLLECSLLTNECASSIGKLTKMRNVKLPSAVDDSGLAQLKDMKGLAALGLQYCRVGKEGLSAITELKELKEINLYGATKVDDECVALLAQLPKLAKARLRETSIRGEAAEAFAEMKAMVDLDLSESPVQNSLMDVLAKLPNLKKLNLWNTQVTDEGIAKLEPLTGLTSLNLQGLGLDLTDAALDSISKMSNLESLVLAETDVSDDGMKKLYSLKKLKSLKIAQTMVLEPSSKKDLETEISGISVDW